MENIRCEKNKIDVNESEKKTNKKNAWHNVCGIAPEELLENKETLRKYGDIIETKWDGVRKHTKASLHDRASQFSPFDALEGFDEKIIKAEAENEEMMNKK